MKYLFRFKEIPNTYIVNYYLSKKQSVVLIRSIILLCYTTHNLPMHKKLEVHFLKQHHLIDNDLIWFDPH
jgi:hypothetical protein